MSEYEQIASIIAKVRVLLCDGNIEQAQDLLDEAAKLVPDENWLGLHICGTCGHSVRLHGKDGCEHELLCGCKDVEWEEVKP